MKVRSCDTCRKQIHEEEKRAFLEKEYTVVKDMIYTCACFTTAAALVVQMQRGRTKEYIQKMFSDMCMIYDTSEVMGKPIILTDVIDRLEKDYDIDFSRIHVNLESQRDFVKGAMKK